MPDPRALISEQQQLDAFGYAAEDLARLPPPDHEADGERFWRAAIVREHLGGPEGSVP